MGELRIIGGKIWREEKFITNEEISYDMEGEDLEINLEADDLITPGLIDFHVHLWSPSSISAFGVAQEKYYREGVIAGAEAGSFGIDNWDKANNYWQKSNDMKVKSFLSILPEGLSIFPPISPTKPENIDTDKIVTKMLEDQSGSILGIKIQLGWLNYKSKNTDRMLLEKAREIADRTNTNMMVHISGQCVDIEETVSKLKKDDIITHVYSGFENTILDTNGKPAKCMFEAKERGVVFDVGHAGKHFSWEVFKSAYKEGITFHTLGSDITIKSYKNKNQFKIYDIFHMLSGFLNYGVELDDVFKALITFPAKYLGIEPDLTKKCLILTKKSGKTELVDGLGESVPCHYEYEPKLFIDHSKIILDKISKEKRRSNET